MRKESTKGGRGIGILCISDKLTYRLSERIGRARRLPC